MTEFPDNLRFACGPVGLKELADDPGAMPAAELCEAVTPDRTEVMTYLEGAASVVEKGWS